MNVPESYFISYPAIKHPLVSETLALKLKYISLLEYYRTRICPTSVQALSRLNRFKSDFLSGEDVVEQDVNLCIRDIMKTRFAPFHFFSYRYVFLFDCVYLLSIDGFDHVNQISELINTHSNKRYHKKLNFMIERMVANPSELAEIQMITPEMIKSLEATRNFLATEEKTVAFTATMSAGKSTLINALIGQSVAQTKKAACTAAIMEFCSCPVYHPKYNVFIGNEVKRDLMPTEVKEASEGGTKAMTVVGYFNSRVNSHKLRVIDTPGVDFSRNPIHKRITENELKQRNHDLLIYVISVVNYGNEDDFRHLQFIKSKAKYKKIIFAVNMMDTCDFEDDSVGEILTNIKGHLSQIGFPNPIVCPISAKAGFLFKRVLSKSQLSNRERDELDAYCAKYQDINYDMSPYYFVSGVDRLCDEGHLIKGLPYDHIYQLYLRTGLPQFESIILKQIEEE